ncbi:MAG: hypothetical protein AB9M60_15475 [Leptothrix sp. (in: b-proteobacteria)]
MSTHNLKTSPSPTPRQNQPWWRHGMVWLVLSGPALVIVASFITFGLIAGHPDPDVREGNAAQVKIDTTSASTQPALQARNHAATGGQ